MPACKISQDIIPADCISLGKGGVQGTAYGIDKEVWNRATIVEDNTTCDITGITLTATGDRAYKYDLARGAIVASSPMTKNNGGKSGFAHSLMMHVPFKDMIFKKDVANYVNFGTMVWIILLDSDVTANVYGRDVGLTVSAYDELPNDPSKGGGFDVTWATPADSTLENLPATTFFNTDAATTIAALEALLVPVA